MEAARPSETSAAIYQMTRKDTSRKTGNFTALTHQMTPGTRCSQLTSVGHSMTKTSFAVAWKCASRWQVATVSFCETVQLCS
jgi:hypothetical protein